jgi:hypothetical protein
VNICLTVSTHLVQGVERRTALHVWAETVKQMFTHGGAGDGVPTSAIEPLALVRNMQLSPSLTPEKQHDAGELALALIAAAQLSLLRRAGVADVSATGTCQLSLAAQQTTMLMRLLGSVTRSQLYWSKAAEVASLRKKADDASAKGDNTAVASFQSALRAIENAQADGPTLRSHISSFESFTILPVPLESCSVRALQVTRVHVLPPCPIIHLKSTWPTRPIWTCMSL